MNKLQQYGRWVFSEFTEACRIETDVGKAIAMPKGAEKEVPDIMLNR